MFYHYCNKVLKYRSACVQAMIVKKINVLQSWHYEPSNYLFKDIRQTLISVIKAKKNIKNCTGTGKKLE